MLWKGWDSVLITFIPQPLGRWPVGYENCALNEVAQLLTGRQTPARSHSLASVASLPRQESLPVPL